MLSVCHTRDIFHCEFCLKVVPGRCVCDCHPFASSSVAMKKNKTKHTLISYVELFNILKKTDLTQCPQHKRYRLLTFLDHYILLNGKTGFRLWASNAMDKQ